VGQLNFLPFRYSCTNRVPHTGHVTVLRGLPGFTTSTLNSDAYGLVHELISDLIANERTNVVLALGAEAVVHLPQGQGDGLDGLDGHLAMKEALRKFKVVDRGPSELDYGFGVIDIDLQTFLPLDWDGNEEGVAVIRCIVLREGDSFRATDREVIHGHCLWIERVPSPPPHLNPIHDNVEVHIIGGGI